MRNLIDIFQRQRAKQHWMEDGDRNAKFFHRVANARRKLNAIQNIVVDGERHVEDSFVEGAIDHFYEKLYHENFSTRPFLEDISYNTISLEDAMELEIEFFEEEAWKAIDLGKEKVLGPDGFNISFFQHCWSIGSVVKGEVMGFFADFRKKDLFEKR